MLLPPNICSQASFATINTLGDFPPLCYHLKLRFLILPSRLTWLLGPLPRQAAAFKESNIVVVTLPGYEEKFIFFSDSSSKLVLEPIITTTKLQISTRLSGA